MGPPFTPEPGSPLDPSARAAVGAALDGIEAAHGIRILFAVESGSRAWGFPSPDSDYDCRFVFVRPRERYLSLWPERDVIELPPDRELDVNGWDVAKALRLLCRGNAVLPEWLASPLVYRAVPGLRERFAAVAARLVDRNAVGRHYLHLGEKQMNRHLADGPGVPGKKIFYALRPAVACRWLRCQPSVAVPPMDLPTLLAGSELPADILAYTGELVIRKAAMRELGTATLPSFLRDFLVTEFAEARRTFADGPVPEPSGARAIADAFFREVLAEFG